MTSPAPNPRASRKASLVLVIASLAALVLGFSTAIHVLGLDIDLPAWPYASHTAKTTQGASLCWQEHVIQLEKGTPLLLVKEFKFVEYGALRFACDASLLAGAAKSAGPGPGEDRYVFEAHPHGSAP